MAEILATSAVVVVGLMLIIWLVSGLVHNASIVDLVWGLGFVLVAWAALVTAAPDPPDRGRSILLMVLTAIWGLRLTVYLTWRNLGKGEDYRYRAMRAKHGDRFFLVSLGTVFGLQAVLMWVVSLPVQVGIARPGAGDVVSWLLYAGIGLWAIGFLFETVGDGQLARFKSDPANAGRVMDRGLWRYTRHPNYFGDFCVWWGLFLIAAPVAGHWWTMIGPVVMTALLTRYSGAGLLEKTIQKRRPEYVEYMRRTNAFVPGPPKQDARR